MFTLLAPNFFILKQLALVIQLEILRYVYTGSSW